MKKNFIYTVTFLLCGAIGFSSCEDMLNVESDRVEYEFDNWTLNDSVYSVLGILKGVQEVGDRQVLLNELRADLLSISEKKAVVDIQELSKSIFNVETNKYLDVKDYYSIINNCNIYLARVDTTLEKNNVKLMLPEYVAVKSVRAWTYLQLVINYNQIPYYTTPILTHSEAEKVMNQPMLSREEVISNLITDILPYENPAAYPMPAWDADGKVLKFGYGDSGTEVETGKLFMPVRMLLGDLYLWRGAAGDYKKAAQCYYDFITGAGTNETAAKYSDGTSFCSRHTATGGKKNFDSQFASKFTLRDFANNSSYILAMVPYAKTSLEGSTSELASVFLPANDIGGSQVFASPGIVGLSERQIYRYAEGDDLDRPDLVEYSHNYEQKGDLRLPSVTCSQTSDDVKKTEYKNLIAKFNLEEAAHDFYVPKINVTNIVLLRPEHAYLRFAEALMGMEREGYYGAKELAMVVLKEGVKKQYVLYQNPTIADSTYVDNFGKEITVKYVVEGSASDSLAYDFTDEAFTNNLGIHSHGSGDSERNEYYALDGINVARYFGLTETVDGKESIKDSTLLTDELYQLYVSELILDEMALELAWEGTRFGDLVRVAKALNDPDVLALRVAGRAFQNEVSHRHPEFEIDNELYNKLKVETNWYLPLPGEVVEPSEVVETPEDFDPSQIN